MKKIIFTLFIVLIIVSLLFAISGCLNDANKDTQIDIEADRAYYIEIIGIIDEPIIVTKAQIFEIAEEKGMVYDEENPCYASDKTDEDNNLIPRTLKGVYLDDILEVYGFGVTSASFSVMTLKGEDGYENVLTSDTFNPEQGGSRMIIAYEYEGHVLNVNQSSGALRAVFPDQAANYWAKALSAITFADAALVPPSPQSIYFVEKLIADYSGSYTRTETTNQGELDITYYGLELDQLFDEGILSAEQTDKMYLSAWDFVSNGTDYFYREYTNWKSYEYYRYAYLVYQEQEEGGSIVDEIRAPVFEGENIQKGMSVKNLLVLTITDTALVSLKIAFERFDPEDSGEFILGDILALINIENNKDYTVFDVNDIEYVISGAELYALSLSKDNDTFYLIYDDDSIEIKNIIKQ